MDHETNRLRWIDPKSGKTFEVISDGWCAEVVPQPTALPSTVAPLELELWPTDGKGNSLSTLDIVSMPCCALFVKAGRRLYKVLNKEVSYFNKGYAYLVLNYQTVEGSEFMTIWLPPYISVRFGDGNMVVHVKDYHSAMPDAMLLIEDADGFKWVPLLRVDRNGQMLTAHYQGPKGNSSIDIAV
jgi:hypothetical protein